MKVLKNPDKLLWKEISNRQLLDDATLTEKVKGIMTKVKDDGDRALKEFSRKFDGCETFELSVSKEEIESAVPEVDEELKKAILLAKSNIEKFHKSQLIQEPVIETMDGVQCWRKNVAIEKVGIYIPGGSAPLFSTILMLAIPANIAGCSQIVMCTPPEKNGTINPVILYTAQLSGIQKIYKVGGAQAIAAMAYGTESVPSVNKIFGPGNQYVTKAKELIQQEGVAIDMPAGPSELLVVADETCNPEFVAADLLSQAEHGPDSQVMLVSDQIEIVNKIMVQVEKQLSILPRKQIADLALKNSSALVFSSLDECMGFSNFYAPEHLIIACKNDLELSGKVMNAGSVFLGNYSCESAGDYASGTNHTLPTNGYARNYSGVSVDSFLKKITFQKISKEGLRNIGPSIELMADAEQLAAHRNAVSIRLKTIGNG